MSSQKPLSHDELIAQRSKWPAPIVDLCTVRYAMAALVAAAPPQHDVLLTTSF